MEHSFLESLMIWLVNTLMNSAWQVPLVLLVAMVAARLVARLYSAAAVHWTWVSALVLATVLPAIRVEMWPRFPWGGAGAVAGGHVQVTMMPGTAVAGGHLRISMTLMAILLGVYGAVILYFAGRIVWGVWTTRALRGNASEVQLAEPLQMRWDGLCRRMNVTRVVLCESAAVAGPAMVGMQTILLPVGFIGKVQEGDLLAAMAHELAHVRRRDYAKNVGYAVLMLPVAYHPCAWLIKKAVGESREAACDAMAAEVLDSRRMYARSLVRLAMVIPAGLRGGATAAVGIFEGNTLERRVRLMMQRGKRLRGLTRVAAMMAVLLLSGVAVVSLLGTHVTVQAANATAGKEGAVQVPSHVMAARIVKQVQPKYPMEAKKKKIQGTVVLNVKIGKDGTVEDLKVASGPKELQQSALVAVRQWTYEPFLVNGDPVEVNSTISVVYSLRE
ncbi:MAG: M56 family metallopeptidase [Acidobacteriaceae bacterium]